MKYSLLAITTSSLVEEILADLRSRYEIRIHQSDNLPDALTQLTTGAYNFLLADFNSLGHGAVPLLKRLNRMVPLTDLLLIIGSGDDSQLQDIFVDLLIDENLSLAEITNLLRQAIETRQLLDKAGMRGHSPNLREVAERIRQVSPTGISVLVSGPSGTGKELVARAIHENSPRRDADFVSINCASIPESLLESELFGHLKGAFTGADRDSPGLFQTADKGTLFLDEIGELHPHLQAKLLRAIESKTFTPVGGRKPVKVDVRIITATNRELSREVEKGTFRADLFYRLGVINITLKRLADRPEDILAIVAFLLRRQRDRIGFTPEATELLLKYGWPGNVRELSNFLQRLLITEPEGQIDRDQVTTLLEQHGDADPLLPVATNLTPEESSTRLIYQALVNLANEISEMKKIILRQSEQTPAGEIPAVQTGVRDMESMEEKLIRDTLTRVSGNRKKAANLLGIGERTLYRKLKKYDIS